MNWTSLDGLDGDEKSHGYYITESRIPNTLYLTNRYSPSRGFEHLYNTFEVSISITPQVIVRHQTCDDDYYKNKLHLLKNVIEIYSALHYKFTFNIFQLKHIAKKYHLHLLPKYTLFSNITTGSNFKPTGYYLVTDKDNKIICTLDGHCGFKVYSHNESEYILKKFWWLHFKSINRFKIKNVSVKYQVPKPLAHVCQLWSKDLKAYLIANNPQLVY